MDYVSTTTYVSNMTTHQFSPYRLLMHNVVCATRCALRFISTTLGMYRPICDSVLSFWYFIDIGNDTFFTSETNHYYPPPTVCEMETIKFSLESPSLVSTPHCPRLETYGICEAMCFVRVYMHMTTVADNLGSARFNILAKSSLSELMYIINE